MRRADIRVAAEDGKLVGDVDFVAVAPAASAISPIPGGVGAKTVAMRLNPTRHASERSSAISS